MQKKGVSDVRIIKKTKNVSTVSTLLSVSDNQTEEEVEEIDAKAKREISKASEDTGCQYFPKCTECGFPYCVLYERPKGVSKVEATMKEPISDKSDNLVKNTAYISRRRGRLKQLKNGKAKIVGEAIIDGIRLIIYKGQKEGSYWAVNGKEYIEIPESYIKDKWC